LSWELRFDQPIYVPDAKPLRTLAEARAYILALPKHLHKTRPVLTATEALIMAATKTGPLLHAQVGMIQLIHGKPDGRIDRKPNRKFGKRLPATPSRSGE
jgi:hypothetical protein